MYIYYLLSFYIKASVNKLYSYRELMYIVIIL
jgi:hypothetical protein